jgi:hypothetical protein
VLFQAWSDAICINKKPPIKISDDCLVGKYAIPVIYYVSGWTLFSASKALTVAVDKRQLFFMFLGLNTINKQTAKVMSLPTSLVERRNWRALIYCT